MRDLELGGLSTGAVRRLASAAPVQRKGRERAADSVKTGWLTL